MAGAAAIADPKSDQGCKVRVSIAEAVEMVTGGAIGYPEAVRLIEESQDARLTMPTVMREVESGRINHDQAGELIKALIRPEERAAVEKHVETVRERELRQLRAKLLRDTRLEGEQLKHTLDSYEIRAEGQREPLQRARAFAKFVDARKFGMVYFGAPGVGKTHLAEAICQAVTQRDDPRPALYVDCFALAQMRKNDPKLDAAMLTTFLLVLNDVDKIFYGDAEHWLAALVKRVIDKRAEEQRLMVITTELSLEEHDAALKGPDADVAPGVLHWLASRMQPLTWVRVDGPDGRGPEYMHDPWEGQW